MPNADNTISVVNAGWTFAGISGDFDEHIARSVPLYHEGHDLICKYADFFLGERSTVYEIGCSTGALTRKLLARNMHRKDLRVIGIDVMPDMVAAARERGQDDLRGSYVCENA